MVCQTGWDFENDNALRGMIFEVGAAFTGWANPPVHLLARDWQSMMVQVKITGNIAPGITSLLLYGRASEVRVLAGRTGHCDEHAWDIMIIRDVHTRDPHLSGVTSIASRQFDVLLMKICDFEYPWTVLAVKDVGPSEVHPGCSTNGQ